MAPEERGIIIIIIIMLYIQYTRSIAYSVKTVFL